MILDAAISHIQNGRLDLAAASLRDHLARHPDDAPSNRLLGKLLFQTGQQALGLTHLRRALGSVPADPEMNYELGVMLLTQDDCAEAASHFSRTLSQQPDHPDASFNLAWALRRQGKPRDAVAALRRLLDRHPQFGEAWFNLGNILGELGESAEAAEAYQRALALMPGHAGILTNLGALHLREGRLDQAVETCRAALAADPDMVAAASTLGNALAAQGNPDAAIEIHAAMLRRHPGNALLLHNQALARKQAGNSAEAIALLLQALAAAPDMAEAWNSLGAVLLDRDDIPEAEQALRQAVAIRPDFADSHNNLGKLLSQCGRNVEAAASFRRALDIEPGNATIHSNLLFMLLHMPDVSAQALFQEHRAFGLRQEAAAPTEVLPPPRADDILRIGYVSPDFCEHAVMLFFEPVLQSHDRSRFEIYCYHTGTQVDSVTQRVMEHADHWRSLAGLPPAAAAARIVADGIHILVDLAGHSACNGLPIFARKPAHVQATWLGYPATSGLSRMDYRLTDPGCDPGRNEGFHTEKLEFLSTASAFRPQDLAPAIAPPPMLRRGHPRFGMLNRLAKSNEDTFEAWGRLLREEPTADLLMIMPGGEKPSQRAHIHDQFARHGIAADRIIIHGRMPLDKFLALITDVDVALDPFPYGGGTTSILTAWMGVPLVCRAGSSAASSPGALLMSAIGWDELVAHDADGYVANARAMVADVARQQDFRATARQRLQGLLLFTETAITANLEAKYREWWDRLLRDTARRTARAALPLPIRHRDRHDDKVVVAVEPDIATAVRDRKGHVIKRHGEVEPTAEPALFDAPVLEFAPGASLTVLAGDDAGLGAEDFTVESWVWLTTLPEEIQPALLMGRFALPDEQVNAWGMFIGPGGHAFGWVTGSGFAKRDHLFMPTDFMPTDTDCIVPAGCWNHVAMVRSGDQLTFFVNGKGVSQTLPPDLKVFDSTLPITIGANADRAVHFFPHKTFVSGPRLTRGIARYTADFDTAKETP